MPDRQALFTAYAVTDRSRRHVRVNFVSSADGAVTLSGHSGGLGGQTDRTLLHVLRAMADVVVVGAGTVRAEGYGGLGMSEQDLAWRRGHGLSDVPALAVVSNRLDLEPDSPVFQRADGRTIVLTNDSAPSERAAALSEVADVVACGADRVRNEALLAALEERGLRQVLSEGGPHLFGSLLADDLVDEVCLTLSPRFVAGGASRVAVSPGQLDRGFRPALVLTDDDGFVFLRYLRTDDDRR